MITVTRGAGTIEQFPTATRVSTDEFNNLEVWAGRDGHELLWLCAVGGWLDVTLTPEGS